MNKSIENPESESPAPAVNHTQRKRCFQAAAHRSSPWVAALAASLALFNLPVQAATTIVKSDTTTMASASDWGGTAPVAGEIGQFDSTLSAVNATNLTLGGAVALDGITFLGTMNGPVTVAADGNTLTLGAATGINMSAANNDVTFNCPVKASTGVLNVPAGRTLTLGGGSTGIFGSTSIGLGTLLLSAPSPVAYTAAGSGPILNLGNPFTGVGGTIIGTNCSVSSPASFTTANGGNGLITVNGGTLNITATGFLIIGRGAATSTGRVILTNGLISFAAAANVLIGFQNAVGELDVRGGVITANGSYAGIDTGSTSAGTTNLLVVSGGVASFKAIDLGGGFSASSVGKGYLVVNGGALYVGSGGIVKLGTGTFAQSTTLSGGTLGAFANWSSSLPMTLTNDTGNITFKTADTNGNPFNITLSGALTGPGGLNKIGGGILTLSGTDTYAGSTVVSNGTLVISTGTQPTNGPVTVDGAAGTPILSLTVANVGQSWTIGAMAWNNGTPTLDFNYGIVSPSAAIAPIQINGNLAFGVTPGVTIEGSAIPVGTFPLMHYTGSLSGTVPTTAVITLAGGSASGYVTNLTATKTIALVVTSSTYNPALTWRGGNGIWDMSTFDWTAFGIATNYIDGNVVQLDDTASGSSPISVTLNTTVMPSSASTPSGITVSAGTKNYIISGTGSIAGGVNLTKIGNGALTLAGTNTYSGGTTLAGGQLNINYGGDGSANSAIGTGPLTLTGGFLGNTSGTNLTLLTPISQNWNGNFGYSGSTNSLNLGAGAIGLGRSVAVNVVSNVLEVDGSISDNVGGSLLTKLGNGALALAGPNTYAGGTLLSEGQLNINYGGDGGADTAVGTGTFTIADGTAIDNTSGSDVIFQFPVLENWNDNVTFIGSGNLDLGYGKIVFTATSALVLTVNSNTLACEGVFQGNGRGLQKLGNGTLAFNGYNNNAQFQLVVDAGTVVLNKLSPYYAIPNAVVGAIVDTNGTLMCADLGANPSEFQAQAQLILRGGTFDLFGSSQAISSLTFSGGILENSNTNNTTSTLTFTNAAGVVLSTTNCQVFVATNSTLALDPNPSAYGFFSGSGSLIKTGPGQLVLSGNNTYTGATTVSAGTLALTDPYIDGGGTISNSAVIHVYNGATLDVTGTGSQVLTLNNHQTLLGAGSINGGLAALAGSTVSPGPTATVGTFVVTNNVSLAGTLLLNLNRTNAQNCSHLISATGTITYGGALVVTNAGPALLVGDKFQLFPAAVTAFSGISLATADASGNIYTWNNNVALDGSITVASVAPAINPNPGTLRVAVSGNVLTLSWPTNAGWLLQAQTNSLATGLNTNWVTLPGSGSVTSTNLPVNPANGAVFYRMLHP